MEEHDRAKPVGSIGSMFLSAGRDRCSQTHIPQRRKISVGSVLTLSNQSLVSFDSSSQIVPGIPSKRKPLPELFPRVRTAHMARIQRSFILLFVLVGLSNAKQQTQQTAGRHSRFALCFELPTATETYRIF